MEPYFQNKIKIAIVGGGPAGIYCALTILSGFKKINFTNFFITVFDKAKVLNTILPTGGGRCNITNSIDDIKDFCLNYPRGAKFLYSIFAKHFIYDTLEFFNSIGIETYTQDDNRIFPKSNSASDVRNKLLDYLQTFENYRIINKEIKSFEELSSFDKVIISTGSRNCEELIKSTNHTCVPFKRALCALNIENNIYPKGVSVKTLDGEFIFTDKGISGPLAFKVSSLRARDNFPYNIEINLFNPNELKELIKINSKKSIGNVVSILIPKSLACVIVDDFDKKASEVSSKQLEKYSKLNLKVVSTAANGEIVNAGGIKLTEVDKNLKSKIQANLWFCGEVLDIDGFCGGFNLQNCWSTAWVAASDVINSLVKV